MGYKFIYDPFFSCQIRIKHCNPKNYFITFKGIIFFANGILSKLSWFDIFLHKINLYNFLNKHLNSLKSFIRYNCIQYFKHFYNMKIWTSGYKTIFWFHTYSALKPKYNQEFKSSYGYISIQFVSVLYENKNIIKFCVYTK